MDKFHVGQKVVVIGSLHCKEMIGETVTITESRKERVNYKLGLKWLGYRIDLQPSASQYLFYPEERFLKAIDDSNEKSSWENCVWKPRLNSLIKE